MLGLSFSSKLDWGSYIISIAKTTSKKIRALIHSMKFLSPEVALCLYKSIIWSQAFTNCMHSYNHACNVHASSISCAQKFVQIIESANPSHRLLYFMEIITTTTDNSNT